MKSYLHGLLERYFIRQPRFRLLVTRLLEPSVNKEIELFGTRLCINSIKEHGYLRAHRKLSLQSALRDEAGVILTLALLLSQDDTFIDVGANVGLFACALARRQFMGGSSRIYAFEANPDTFKRLVKSAEGLGIKLRQVAISDRAGELSFIAGAVSHVFTEACYQNSYHFKRQETIAVRAQPLDEIDIVGNSILMKIDVEGQELKVLHGATQLFDDDRIKAVYVDGYADNAVPEWLSKRGFNFFDGQTLHPVDQPNFNLLAIKLSKC